ncbi:MAG: DUF4214 domain-containing protein [Pseudomonadota bacterium]
MCLSCGNPAAPCLTENVIVDGLNYPSGVPFEGTKLGGGLGEGSGVITWSFSEAGVLMTEFNNNTFSRDFSETFRFDAEARIREAFEIWSAVANVDFMQVADDRVAGDDPSNAFTRVFHGVPVRPDTYGSVYFPGERPRDGNIMIADDPIALVSDAQGFPVNFVDLVLHQIGHVLGFNHPSFGDSVMLSSVFFGNPGLGVDDRLAASTIYGLQDGEALVYRLAEGQEGIDAISATDRLIIEGNALDNELAATDTGDTLRGGAGEDRLMGRAGDDLIVGGSGLDRALFAGDYGQNGVQLVEGGATLIGPDGTDAVFEVEWLVFSDGVLSLDLQGAELGFLFRLYDAVFDRAPDAGLLFWQQARADGYARRSVMEDFFSSEEYRLRFGEVDDPEFVQALYQNVLGRNADEAGEAYWLQQFAAGLPRGDMVFYFSESAENIALSQAVLANGLFFEAETGALNFV